MPARAIFALFLPTLAAALCACAPLASIAVAPPVAPPGALRVHLAPVRDYPGAPGSGARIRAELRKRLPKAGFRLVDYGADAIALVSLSDYSRDKAQEVAEYPAPWPESVVVQWHSAHISLTARLVDARTGRVLWAASSTSHPDAFQTSLDYTYRLTTDAAVGQVCDELVSAISRRLR